MTQQEVETTLHVLGWNPISPVEHREESHVRWSRQGTDASGNWIVVDMTGPALPTKVWVDKPGIHPHEPVPATLEVLLDWAAWL